MMKSYKILKLQHLTMKVDGQSGLIHIMGFITHMCWLLKGPEVTKENQNQTTMSHKLIVSCLCKLLCQMQ